jgi:GNAT superfamily N-acetyltransferase
MRKSHATFLLLLTLVQPLLYTQSAFAKCEELSGRDEATKRVALHYDLFLKQAQERFQTVLNKQITVRTVTAADLNRAQAHINRVRANELHEGEKLEDVFDHDLDHFQENYQGLYSRLFIAENDQGTIIASGGISQTSADELELRKIYFDPSIRGLGLGKFWIHGLTQLGEDFGFNAMWLINHKLLGTATHLYRNEGYEEFIPTAKQSYGMNTAEYRYFKKYYRRR